MCIAILQLPKSDKISDEILKRCSKTNKDGFGLIYIEKEGVLKTFKTLDFKHFQETYDDIHQKHNKFPIVLHFRLGTSGGKDLENCHPFLVNNDLAFVHNGIINIQFKTKEKTFSDSYLFNEEYLKPLIKTETIVGNNTIVALLEDLIDYNKIIFINSSGQYSILNEKKGDWEKGIWYSNSGWKPVEVFDHNYTSRYGGLYNYKKTCHLCNEQKERNEMVEFDTVSYTRHVCFQCLLKKKTRVKDFFKTKDFTLTIKKEDPEPWEYYGR